MLALSLHSRRHESARPLRNTAAAYSVPTLRARREAPSLVSGFGVGFTLFQPAGALSTGQYMRAVPKQRKPPQTANRLDGRHAPWLRLRGMCSFSLWTRHYRKYRLVNRQRLARVGGAPTETVNVRLSPFESVKAPHQTLMHTQSAFQYWGAQVIGHTFGCA